MDRNYASCSTHDDESLQYREFSLTSANDIALSDLSYRETTYRSIEFLTTHSLGTNPFSPEFENMGHGPVSLRKESSLNVEKSFKIAAQNQLPTQCLKNLKPLELPDFLVNTHFETELSLETVCSFMDLFLRETGGLSFEFDDNCCQWTVVHLNGSNHCKFQITIYIKCTIPKSKYVIEGNRLRGDKFLFQQLYSQIKCNIARSTSPSSSEFRDSFTAAIPLIPTCSSTDEKDLSSCLECVFRMAHESTCEAQLEASRILCDLSLDVSLLQTLVDRGVLSVLRTLICDSKCPWAPQHAILALSNFADANIFQNAIIREGFLPVLLRLACDGPFQTAELRRSAVHILAQICSSNANDVAKALGKRDVAAWIDTVESFQDERLKRHATRARDCLSRIVFAS